jgi:2-polyprenyl-6-hydroxyphenyl methylase/3-demethylubiquinone-9 3-methyltransferase
MAEREGGHVPENVDVHEIAKFEALAHRWWDPTGDFRPLHDINPARLAWIAARCPPSGRRAVDVGCGGGILAEALARAGADVAGIDMGEAPLAVARLHALEAGVAVDYRQATAESLAAESPGAFDLVTCMEMLEHVPDPASVVGACATLARKGGHLFFSTINRNPKAWALAVVGAEYVLRLLPRGTHEYAKFIRPSELARAVRAAGLDVVEIAGMRYNPFTRDVSIDDDVDVNYLLYARKPDVP